MRIKYFMLVPIFLLVIPLIISSTVLKQGEIYETGKKELIVENIRSDKIKVNVDGVKNIVNIGEQKEINGVNILLESVFYTDELEDRTATVVISMAFYCGDGTCDTEQNETKENCCEDCGCMPGYVCSDGVCKTEAQIKKEEEEEEEKSKDECEKDIDCDDNDSTTDDICISKPGKPNKCLHMLQICQADSDCDDQNPCTVDRCVDHDCFNTKMPDYVACLKKQEALEIEDEEESEVVSEEVIEEGFAEEPAEKEPGLFSRIISLFLNLFR